MNDSRIRLALLSLLLLAAPAFADPMVVRLSEAEKAAVLANRADHLHARPDAPTPFTIRPFAEQQAAQQAENATGQRRMQGEMGMMIGSGGQRGLYGSTAIPLGNDAAIGLSFGTGRNLWRGPVHDQLMYNPWMWGEGWPLR